MLSSDNSPPTTTATSISIDVLAARFFEKILGRKKNAIRLESQADEMSHPPWDPWELDKDFFKAFSRWTLDNPETSLDRVLDRISDGLESNKDLFQLIPDSPFPARGLVTALAHLFKLGVKISRAKKDVHQFAKDVVNWVGLVKSAFETPGDGRFTRQSWQNLSDMRVLIDEACTWAAKRLNDGRWSRIGHGLRIQSEIQEFMKRIADARALFQDLSSISQAKGLDVILQNLHRVERHEIIVAEIEKFREAQDRQLREIMSEIQMQKQIAERNRFFAETLNVRTVADPTYDAQGKRPCDEDTRTDVLAEIRDWANDLSSGVPNFLWLTGDPGCGKSAVTASLARECKDKGTLWAQFFINRNNVETTDPRSYFPSIARQLANRSTDVAATIHHILLEQLSLLDDISPAQASKLFTDSVRVASQVEPDRPVVIIIDGLDETSRVRLEDTAKIFSTLFTTLRAHVNVKVFISSRTENEIQKSFIRPRNQTDVKRVHLDTAHPSSVHDVSLYIKRNLLNLVTEHDLNWDVWPGDERSQMLGTRASGLFIWAVTAIKFIQEQIHSNGSEGLSHLLELLTADVLHDINALYTLILMITHGDHRSEWEVERFRRIVGTIVFLQEPLSISDLAAVLDLRKEASSDPVDIIHFVRRFRTLLVTGTDNIDGKTIPRIHKSVFEYITSNSVNAEFRIDPDLAHLELAIQCLSYLGAARDFVGVDMLPTPFRYASRFWSSHLSQANIPGPKTICADCRRSLAPSLLPKLEPSIHNSICIQHVSATSRVMMGDEIWDVATGNNIYHKGEITCMVFSPNGEQIVSCSVDKTIRVWNSSNGEWIRTFVRHSSEFRTIAFSPDGKSLVSGSDDGLVYRWDCLIGAPIGGPLQKHEGAVTCIAFSSDGERVVSGSEDKSCLLWDVQNRRAVGKPWTNHRFKVRLVAFSANSQKVCSVDWKGYCITWDVNTGQSINSWHSTGFPWCLSFSPKDDNVVVLGGRRGISIRALNRQWSIAGSEDTLCLLFSPNGELMFNTWHNVAVAQIGKDESTARIIRNGDYPRRDHITAPALSPNFDRFAYVNDARAIHFFALEHDKASLKAVSTATQLRTVLKSKHDGDEMLRGALTNLKKSQRIQNAVQDTNRRLREISWHETDSSGGAVESDVRAYVVGDDVAITGYKDGLISVWNKHVIEK